MEDNIVKIIRVAGVDVSICDECFRGKTEEEVRALFERMAEEIRREAKRGL